MLKTANIKYKKPRFANPFYNRPIVLNQWSTTANIKFYDKPTLI